MRKNNVNRYQKKKNKKGLTIVLAIIAIIATSLVVWIGMNNWNPQVSYDRAIKALDSGQKLIKKEPKKQDDKTTTGGEVEQPVEQKPEKPIIEPNVDPGGYIEGQTLPAEPTYVDGFLVANKKYPLPSTFKPGESKEAREAFNKMAAAAKLEGFSLDAFSTYRSYDRQVELYERYVSRDGEEAADTYSARPGYSEHQTGLAFDIGEVGYSQHYASASFGDTEAGKWISKNAHKYGFIMRYPKGKEHITGYMHESWHYRYVGEAAATVIYENDSTLEEYLGI